MAFAAFLGEAGEKNSSHDGRLTGAVSYISGKPPATTFLWAPREFVMTRLHLRRDRWLLPRVGLAMVATIVSLPIATADGPDQGGAADGQPAAPQKPAADRHPELRRLSPTDEIWIDLAKKEVVVGGKVALREGILEVFACPELSKEHEAVVATKCPARLVHAGLLAIGLETGAPARFVPEYVPPTGSKVKVRVRWKDDDGKMQERPAQEWVRNTDTGEALAVDWVFVGSGFWRDPADGTEHYEADAGDMICLSNFPSAMLDIPVESSDANEDLLFEAFEERVPQHGTPVELILSAGD
jgi:hypothetical protein